MKEQKTLYTIDQFVLDVAQKPDAPVYYHPTSTWWTNKYEDLEKAREQGSEAVLAGMRRQLLATTDLGEHKRLQHRYNVLSESGKSNIPLAPDGSPLYLTDQITFLQNNGLEMKRLGEYGLHMIMAHHHHNSGGMITTNWEDLNDIAKELSEQGLDEKTLLKVISGKKVKEAVPVKSAGVPSRNDLCPCGSGNKWKRCHGK